jgi:hypothetical protein
MIRNTGYSGVAWHRVMDTGGGDEIAIDIQCGGWRRRLNSKGTARDDRAGATPPYGFAGNDPISRS